MADRKTIAGAVRRYLARERMSREEFAFRTRLGKSTIDKLLIGRFSDRTLAIVEGETGLRFQPDAVAAPAAGVIEAPAPVLEPPDGPSIAVLPLTNLNGDPAQDYLADGISDDITTELSRLRWLFVIARNSAFAYKGRAVDVRRVGRELGVRYVLEGAVRTMPGRMRVTSQLVHAESGQHIWAERYDCDLGDIFAVQDEIARNVIAAIEPQIYAAEGFRAARQPPESIDAWGLVVRAIGLLSRVGKAQNHEAQDLARRAIAIEPGYARAHAVLAWALWWATLCYAWPDPGDGFQRAARHAEDAVTLDPAEPWARMILGLCVSNAAQHDRALAELRMSTELNPNSALGRTAFGWALLRAGHTDAALVETGRALRMSPTDTFAGIYTSVHGLALLAAGRFAEALPVLRASVAAFNEYPGHYHTLISCCGHLGLIDEATRFIEARNRIGLPLRRSVVHGMLTGFAHRDIFVAGLEKAGVPE